MCDLASTTFDSALVFDYTLKNFSRVLNEVERIMKSTALRSLLFFCFSPAAFGSLVLSSTVAVSGSGLGTVATLLTVQAQSIESGCVGATTAQIGDTVNSLGICTGTGADVKAGVGQIGPQPLSAAGITSASNFAVVFNANQSGGGPITITALTVSFYRPDGTFIYQTSGFSCPGLPGDVCYFPSSQSGTGSSGFPFNLDPQQQAEATAAGVFDNTANIVGIAAQYTGTNGGSETLYLANFIPAPSGVPEPQSFVLALSGGMLLFGCVAWKRKQQA